MTSEHGDKTTQCHHSCDLQIRSSFCSILTLVLILIPSPTQQRNAIMATIKVSVLAALVVVATAQTDFQQYALLSSNIAQQTAALQAQLAQSLR